jgi:DNA-binding IscR family transcriptional regulator
VLDVVLAVDGAEPAFTCTEIRQCGPAACAPSAYRGTTCGIARVMWAAEDAWRQSSRAVTVADLLDDALRNAPPKQLAAGAAWIQEVIR